METSNKTVSRYDVAAFMALMNMLKINLSLDKRPEVYRTLLAVLVDYDPEENGNRERTVRYIHLLLADEDLANLLVMYLPSHIKPKHVESPAKPKAVMPQPLDTQKQLLQKIKVKHLRRRKPFFRPFHTKKPIYSGGSSSLMVTPDIESAASSLLEMSNNAAARKKSINMSAVTQLSSVGPKIQASNSASKSISSTGPVMEQSNKTSVDVMSDRETAEEMSDSTVTGTVTITSSSKPPLLKIETCISDISISQSGVISNQSCLGADTNNSAQTNRCNSLAFQTKNYPPVSSSFIYNSPRLENQYQTVQNFCQNLYQGINLYHNPVSAQIQRQFSFVQPWVQQPGVTVSYQLPQVPYIPYPTGYPSVVPGQMPAWSYVPNYENQYPVNLSVQSHQPSATSSNQESSLSQSVSINIAEGNFTNLENCDAQKLKQGSPQANIKRSQTNETENLNNNASFSSTQLSVEIKPEVMKVTEAENSDNANEEKNALLSGVGKNLTSQAVVVSTSGAAIFGLPKVSKSELQALSDLTLGIGLDTCTKESRIFLGAGMKDTKPLHMKTMDSDGQHSDVLTKLPSPDLKKNSHLMGSHREGKKSEKSLTPVVVSSITPLSGTMIPISTKSEEINYGDTNRKRLSLTSFPYTQEIKLPDGQKSLIELKGDCISMASLETKQGSGVNTMLTNISIGHQVSPVKLQIDNKTDCEYDSQNVPVNVAQGKAKTVQELLQLRNSNSAFLNAQEQMKRWKNSQIVQSVPNSGKGFLETGLYKGRTESEQNNQQQCNKQSECIYQRSEMNKEYKMPDAKSHSASTIKSSIFIKSEDLNYTMNSMTAESPYHLDRTANLRSRSDRSIASAPTFENTDFEIFPVEKIQRNSRNRKFMSESDSPTMSAMNSQMRHAPVDSTANRCETITTKNDLVHVVDKDKVVTMKVSKYPELSVVSGKFTGSMKSKLNKSSIVGVSPNKNLTSTDPSPLTSVKIGKAPIIRSRIPKSPSYLTSAEREYLDQIQNLPPNIYQNSNLVQLVMKDSKCVRKAQTDKGAVIKHNKTNIERKTAPAVIKVSPEQLLEAKPKVNIQYASKRTKSDSAVLYHDSDNIDKLLNDKSTNTYQDDDDEVFLNVPAKSSTGSRSHSLPDVSSAAKSKGNGIPCQSSPF